MNLGENIFRLRTEKNLSQENLADALEVSRQSVSKWENNTAVPELEKLMKMAKLFDITLDALVSGENSVPEVQRPVPEAQPLHTGEISRIQKILGIIFLCFGLLSTLVFAVLAFLPKVNVEVSFAIVLSVPLILCGIVCLLVEKNAAAWCAWAVYLPFWFIYLVLERDCPVIILVLGVLLGIFTLFFVFSSRAGIGTAGKIAVSLAIALFVAVSTVEVLTVTDIEVDGPSEIVEVISGSVSKDFPATFTK